MLGACRAVFVTSHTSHMHRKRSHPCKPGRAVAAGRKERPHSDEQHESCCSIRCLPSTREDPGVESRGLARSLTVPWANGSCSHPSEQGAGGYVKTKVGSCQFADVVQRLFLIDIGSPIYVQFPQMRSSVCDVTVLRLQCLNALHVDCTV